jgi:type IV pilus assembly protein PilW
MNKKITPIRNNQGFTLPELLVTLIITTIVMAAVYTTYYSQQKSYAAQEQTTAMHQNLRAAMFFMERETRMAGYDPTGTAGAAIGTAEIDTINFAADLDGDGNTTGANENVTYALSGSNLLRNGAPIAENIEVLDFVYLNDDDDVLNDDGDGNVVASIPQIRSVQITLIARTGRPDPGYRDTTVYRNQSLDVLLAPNDNYRRKRLTAEVKCRNLGL